jgi:hypothetical protein
MGLAHFVTISERKVATKDSRDTVLDIRNFMKQISLGMKNLIPFTATYFR